jgi:diguanylate cyclase (GGDEF)-like protein/PAS domain S-box-containing protein
MQPESLDPGAGELLEHYLERSPLALIGWDDEIRFTHWSHQAEAIFGWSAAEVLGKTLAEIGFIVGDDEEHVANIIEELRQGRTSSNATTNRNRHKNGSVVWCRWFNATVTRGGVRTFVSLAEDVTGLNQALSEQHAARERIAQSEEQFRSLFENHPDAMLTLDADSVLIAANAAAARTLGRIADEIIGSSLVEVVSARDVPEALASFNRALGGLAGGIDIAVTSPAGDIPALLTMIPIRVGDHAVGVHVHIRDRRAELAQHRQNVTHAERIRDLYVTAAAANQNAEMQIASTLEAGCRILGMTSAVLYDADAGSIVATFGEPLPPALARLAIDADGALAITDRDQLVPLQADLEAEPFSTLIATRITTAEGTFGSLSFGSRTPRVRSFDDVDSDLVQLMGALVGSAIERGRSRARLQSLAYTDSITTLPNRPWLIEHLRERLAEAEADGTTIGVLFLDLDRFKDINDTLGHESGDRLLRIIGRRLAGAIRSGDCVARMGGDEFVVLALGSPDVHALAVLSERIIGAVEEPVKLNGVEQFVTTSIGVASYPIDGADAETLVKHADVAMYRAKDRGRNTYQFFTPALNASLQSRLTLEKTLRRGLENNEFVVYYQPQHDLMSGAIVAVEALVRWNHPRTGLLLPGHFIPTAELSGLIVAIGDFVLDTACADIAALRGSIAPDLRLSVNLSARQFHQQQLDRKIRTALERAELDPSALELEITESVAMTDAETTIAIMRDLGTDGVTLSVDDFGTGYSSLGYLRRFPLDSIKIDRSFVTDLATEPDDATIVRTVIAMAHALDLEVVAEGVETEEQLAFLREQGCDRVQGFYYSQAVPRDELVAYIEARQARAAVVGG